MAEDGIVNFPSKDEDQTEPLVWICDCSCQTFFVYSNGGHECAQCGNAISGDIGAWKSPPVTEPEERTGQETTTRRMDHEFMRRSIIQTVRNDEVAIIAIIRKNGGVQTHQFDFVETPLQKDWVSQCMFEATQMIVGTAQDGEPDA